MKSLRQLKELKGIWVGQSQRLPRRHKRLVRLLVPGELFLRVHHLVLTVR